MKEQLPITPSTETLSAAIEKIQVGQYVLEIQQEEPKETDHFVSPPCHLILKSKEGEPLNLLRLLPQPPHRLSQPRYFGKAKILPPFYFCNAGIFRHAIDDGAILFDSEMLKKQPEYIFMLLHEMGHAVSREVHDDEYQEKVNDSKETVGSDEQTGTELLFEERFAWAQAFKLARALRDKHGINLFSLFPDKQTLMGFIRAEGLHSYEDMFSGSDPFDAEPEDMHTKPFAAEKYEQWRPENNNDSRGV